MLKDVLLQHSLMSDCGAFSLRPWHNKWRVIGFLLATFFPVVHFWFAKQKFALATDEDESERWQNEWLREKWVSAGGRLDTYLVASDGIIFLLLFLPSFLQHLLPSFLFWVFDGRWEMRMLRDARSCRTLFSYFFPTLSILSLRRDHSCLSRPRLVSLFPLAVRHLGFDWIQVGNVKAIVSRAKGLKRGSKGEIRFQSCLFRIQLGCWKQCPNWILCPKMILLPDWILYPEWIQNHIQKTFCVQTEYNIRNYFVSRLKEFPKILKYPD